MFLTAAKLAFANPHIRLVLAGIALLVVSVWAANAYVNARIEAAVLKRDQAAVAAAEAIRTADDEIAGSFTPTDVDLLLCRHAGRSDCDKLGDTFASGLVARAIQRGAEGASRGMSASEEAKRRNSLLGD